MQWDGVSVQRSTFRTKSQTHIAHVFPSRARSSTTIAACPAGVLVSSVHLPHYISMPKSISYVSKGVKKRTLSPPPWASDASTRPSNSKSGVVVLGPVAQKRDEQESLKRIQHRLSGERYTHDLCHSNLHLSFCGAISKESREHIDNNLTAEATTHGGGWSDTSAADLTGMDYEGVEVTVEEDDPNDPEWVDVADESFVKDLNKLTRHLCVHNLLSVSISHLSLVSKVIGQHVNELGESVNKRRCLLGTTS